MNRRLLVLHHASLDAVKIGTFFLILLLGVEAALPGFVSRFFNLNLLVLWILAATAAAFFTHPKEGEGDGKKRSGVAWLQVAGVAAALYAWTAVPAEFREIWRAAAAGGVLMATILTSVLMKKEY